MDGTNGRNVLGRLIGRCVVVVTLVGAATAQAQTTNIYIGANDGAWETPGNWSLGTAPTSRDDVPVIAGAKVLQVRISITSALAAYAGYCSARCSGGGFRVIEP